jgi:DNA-binding PadR family transcriptional regulator
MGPSGDITRMTLLGLLAAKPSHGYDLQQQMKAYSMESWVNIKAGSVYSALPRMASEGLLKVTDVSNEGNRPSKTVYAITGAGRAEFLRLLREAWAVPVGMAQPVDVALFFIWYLPPDEVAAQLAERVSLLADSQANIARTRAITMAIATDPANAAIYPPQYVAMLTDVFDHGKELVQAELAWTQRTLNRVEQGVFTFDKQTKEAK